MFRERKTAQVSSVKPFCHLTLTISREIINEIILNYQNSVWNNLDKHTCQFIMSK